MIEEKRKPSFWVEGKGIDMVILHIKCGNRVEFREVPDDPRFFHVLDCENKDEINCLASGGLYFFDDALEKFKADLEKLEKGQQIIIRRGPMVEAPTRSYKLSEQILEVFERR